MALAFSYQFVGEQAELRAEDRLAAVDGDLVGLRHVDLAAGLEGPPGTAAAAPREKARLRRDASEPAARFGHKLLDRGVAGRQPIDLIDKSIPIQEDVDLY